SVLPTFTEGGGKATRVTSEVVLNALAPVFPELVGGSADLTPSNLTNLKVIFISKMLCLDIHTVHHGLFICLEQYFHMHKLCYAYILNTFINTFSY
ncbi:hypothetical protein EON63_15690, partial [archaeon]